MRSPKLAALELKRFGRGRLPRAALVSLLLLPLLYGALYLWSFWDPYGRLDQIPVALVNEDAGAKADGKKIAAGDGIAAGLHDSKVFDWHEVDAAQARQGLEDGTYYLSLTVPEDFSERIASSAGDSPETGALQVKTNDANNYIVGQLSRTLFSEVRAAASSKASRTFLDKIFVSFSDLHDKTKEAADGAGRLEEGAGKAKDGAKQLADGLGDAKSGSGELARGIKKLDKGSGDLETGAGQVADGTQLLADKVNGASDKVLPFLRENGDSIGDTARLVSDTAGAVRRHLGTLVEKAPLASSGAEKASAALDSVYKARCEDALVDDPNCPQLKQAKDAGDEVARIAADVNSVVQNYAGDTDKLDDHLATLQQQADALAERAPHLAGDVETAVKKINELNRGARAVAKGADQLHTGLTTARTGSSELNSGLGRLKDGAKELDGGLFKLVDGSGELAGGLRDGAEQIPDYGKQDRDARTEVMADPVQLAAKSLHQAPNYGTGFAPYFIPLSLWVGAMVAYMVIAPLNRRALATGASAWRIALAGWLPVAAIGTLQTLALISVLHWALGLQMAHAAGTVGFLLLVTGCFAAIVQWLNARFGPAGRILVLAFLMLQLTSAGGTYPVQTSPSFFGAIHPFLPMTYVVEALRRLITGGGLGPVWQGCAVLIAFTVGALALTALSARKRQVWTLDRLHPELSL
ncbi:YhgE/Pip family protein [Streptomyces sp. NPDC050418]|uniref:YhgE/Pip family protein n=1 Tax=Streptomyces sp. NPDC050418 TaxID=3365612 RepID=UPI00379C1A17